MTVPNPRVEPDAVASVDPLWRQLRSEATAAAAREPELASFLYAAVLNHDRLEEAITHRIASRLDHADVCATLIQQAFVDALGSDPGLAEAMRADLMAVYDRDPACARLIEPVLYFKGYHALQTHRLAHWLWEAGRRDFGLYLQSRASAVFQVDIHPSVPFGRGIFLDHATGIVVGETAVVGNDVSILQDVTLGGTGKEDGDRHPKVRDGVLIGAGAKILGNIEIGAFSRVAAGSVVLKPVPAGSTVAGVPARVIGGAGAEVPARKMDQVVVSDPEEDG